MKEQIKKIVLDRKKGLLVFLAILILGIFLRTYEFRDWMVFNPDQARDAMLVEEVLLGEKSLLLLGPEVGNNRFGLGPWFYHLQIFSAKIFGSEPWKLAIPDLIFSILAIPLFYIFSKKYFTPKISLFLTFFLSVSFFMVRYSRFAFNPNSIPFFVLLFMLGVLYLMEPEKKKNMLGSMMIGLGIGVGMQLHILLFFVMPTVSGLFILWQFFKKYPLKLLARNIAIILFFVFLANTGQILYEVKNGGGNSKSFLKTFTQSAEDSGGAGNLTRDILCQAQANFHILTALGNSEKCDFYKITQKNLIKDKSFLYLVLIAVIFSLGGYFLLLYYWKTEKDWGRKNFLALVFLYGTVSLVAMLPIITQASLRYYIVTFFLPFIFLGVWMKFFSQILGKQKSQLFFILVFAILFFFQFQKIKEVYHNHKIAGASNEDYAIYGEVEEMMDFILENVDRGKEVYVAGSQAYFSRFYKPLLYFGKKSEIKILRGDKTKNIPKDFQVIYVQKRISDEEIKKKEFLGKKAKEHQTFKNVSIIYFYN